ncbi:type I polyketide synthase, partial [Amycolatopsis sp. NPDC004368]
VEGHGTGTRLGDPIEVQALLATYGQDRPVDRPLLLGSVKSNIGHTQAAAGVAGIIKMVMAMRHGVLPRTLHVDEPSGNVEWSAGAVRLLTEQRPWPETGRPRRAAVSSFGMSGTNAHVIIEQGPDPANETEAVPGAQVARGSAVPWLVSGRSEEALRSQAARLVVWARAQPEISPLEVGLSLATDRASLDHRATIVGESPEELVRGLEAVSSGAVDAVVNRGVVRSDNESFAFVFSGQGSQFVGMGRGLYDLFPVFAGAFDAVCARLDSVVGCSLRDVVFSGGSGVLDRTEFAQPGLFAVEVALFRLLESWGVRPGFVVGHSVGEVAAAHVAGVLSLDDACVLVGARGRLMGALPAGGAMVAIEASEGEVGSGLVGGVSVAAVNGSSSVVVSGDEEAVLGLARVWEGRGRRTKQLTVSHAFHSHHMDPMIDEFRRVVEGLSFEEPLIPLVSTVLGRVAGEDVRSPDYWVRNVREPVLFGEGVRVLRDLGVRTFVEVGPGGVLSAVGQADVAAEEVMFVPVLRGGGDEGRSLVSALARLQVRGVVVDWEAFFAGRGGCRVDLPTYAFQRQRYWSQQVTAPSDHREYADADAAWFWKSVEGADFDSLGSVLKVGADMPLRRVLPALADWRRARRERSLLDSWQYRVSWQQIKIMSSRMSGTWLVVVSEAGTVPSELHSLGARVIEVALGGCPGRLRTAELLRQAVQGSEVSGVLFLLGEDEQPHPVHRCVPSGLAATLELVQAIGDAGVLAPLWCVTRNAVSLGSSDNPPHPGLAQVWGLGRVIALEQPRRWGGLIDLQPGQPADLWAQVAGVLGSDGEDHVAVRPSGVYARRLVRASSAGSSTWVPRGTVLIAGGTGGLGAHVARWAARAGADHLLLVSRRGPAAAGAAELESELASLGVRVTVRACDLSDRKALDQVVASVPAEAPLTTVVHAAGVLDDGVLESMTLASFDEVIRAKMDAALALHEATLSHDISAFVLFSSIAATLGSAGQANYAAANAGLDAFAEWRRAQGLPATSIAWGPWAADGMASNDRVERRLQRSGFRGMDPELAVSALAQAVADGEATRVIGDVDWAQFVKGLAVVRSSSSLVVDMPEAREALRKELPPVGVSGASMLERLRNASGPEGRKVVLDLVRSHAAVILGYRSATELEPDRAFQGLGFDSLTAVELSNRIGAELGISLPATLIFDHPTLELLTDSLIAELLPSEDGLVEAVLAELARVEKTLSSPSIDEDARARISARIRAMAANVTLADETSAETRVAQTLESLSDDDMFDIIGKKFGIS